MRIVVVGGTGFVGGELIPLLIAAGHTVLLVTRQPNSLRAQEFGCLVAPLEGWEKHAAGYDTVLYLSVVNSDTKATSQVFSESNVLLPQSVAQTAKSMGIDRFLFFSSVHALDPHAASSYIKSKKLGEVSAARSFGSGFQTVFLGAVHGKCHSGKWKVLNRMPRLMRKIVFGIFSAFSPTTSIDSFFRLVTGPGEGNRQLITDGSEKKFAYRVWRGALDGVFIVGAALLSPAMFLLWLGVVVTNGRPGLFVQERVGKNGRVFDCFKLRTMSHGTLSRGTHLIEDSAVTPFGRFLRKTKIDEIPQALNVLRREMHLIGPRPSLENQTGVIASRRLAGTVGITPGLTGWAQVNGVDMSEPDEIARWDAEYVGLQSIRWDLKILARTLIRRPVA